MHSQARGEHSAGPRQGRHRSRCVVVILQKRLVVDPGNALSVRNEAEGNLYEFFIWDSPSSQEETHDSEPLKERTRTRPPEEGAFR